MEQFSNPLLTIAQASKMLNVHPNTLRNWEKEGKLKALRIGSRRDRRYQQQALIDAIQFDYAQAM